MRNVLLGLILLAACTSARPAAQANDDGMVTRNRLILENASGDPVRVYLEVGGRQIMLGRLGGFERSALRVPTGVIHPGSGDARILIVPLGTPQPLLAGGNMFNGIRSDAYSAYEFLQTDWRYSGNRVMMVLTGR